MKKTCKRCGETKPEEKFALTGYITKSDGAATRKNICSSCHAEKSREWDASNRERATKSRREYRLRNPEKRAACIAKSKAKHRFRHAIIRATKKAIELGYMPCISDESEVRNGYTGKCAICGIPESDCAKDLCMDHCHATGIFRGFLCDHCNRALGYFRDSEANIMKALEYLKGPPDGKGRDALEA